MRSLEFKINSVEQVLKNCKTGWALTFWNDVLQKLHVERDKTYFERKAEYKAMERRPIIFS